MIKKLNIALLIAFAVLIGLKVLKNAVGEIRSHASSAQVVKSAPKASSIPLVIPYVTWHGFVMKNPISNRNGLLLDIMREIFPQAKTVPVTNGLSGAVELLKTNPYTAVIGFGDHPQLLSFPKAETPLAFVEVIVCTRRSNPWVFDGFESLKKLKLGLNDEYLDYPKLREYCEKNPDRVKIFNLPAQNTQASMAEMIEDNEVDGLLATKGVLSNDTDGFSSLYMSRVRASAPIECAATLLRLSNLDPELTKRIISDFETGMKRIRKNGALRRIYEYYGMDYK